MPEPRLARIRESWTEPFGPGDSIKPEDGPEMTAGGCRTPGLRAQNDSGWPGGVRLPRGPAAGGVPGKAGVPGGGSAVGPPGCPHCAATRRLYSGRGVGAFIHEMPPSLEYRQA